MLAVKFDVNPFKAHIHVRLPAVTWHVLMGFFAATVNLPREIFFFFIIQKELCNMILDCCAQQRTYEKFFGLLAGVSSASYFILYDRKFHCFSLFFCPSNLSFNGYIELIVFIILKMLMLVDCFSGLN